MGNCWFFLSYARLDRDQDPHNCIRSFYADLDREIRRLRKIKEGNAGFFDADGIEPGALWPETLAGALANTRALISVYSPAYFDSDYCGKEWNIFASRVDDYVAKAAQKVKRPALAIPVLFDPPESITPLPPALTEPQLPGDMFPAEYRENGLRYLMVRTNKHDVYMDFLDSLVHQLIDVTASVSLPPLLPLPDIKTIPGGFKTARAGNAIPAVTTSSQGPRYADFVYVAGRRSEFESAHPPVKRAIENYGDEGGVDWKPYLPAFSDEVALLAQEVATKEGFRYERLPLNNNLVAAIRQAQADRRIIVIVVDTWTLHFSTYRAIMNDIDQQNFWNSAVLIVWNNGDNETVQNQADLEKALRHAFINKTRMTDPYHFVDKVGSREDFVKYLSNCLQKIKLEILEITRDIKPIDAPVVAKPEITGPGAS